MKASRPSFNNEFDLTSNDLNAIIIKENFDRDNCFVWDANDSNISYNAFVMSKNSRSKTVCEVSFYKSSETDRYIPRLTFCRLSLEGEEQQSRNPIKATIPLAHSEEAIRFWKFIGFLYSYKDLVDTEAFESQYKIVPKESYFIEFKSKDEQQRLKELNELIEMAELSVKDIQFLTRENRKKNLKAFYYLLINKEFPSGKSSHAVYQEKYKLRNGEEYVWHHFLKRNDWILGLNLDYKFVIEFLDEQRIGNPDSLGKENPQTDLLGISEFTTLVELKHTNTNIFKVEKSKGRANTWDFTTDFIEGISQCLGQKFELEKSFGDKVFVKEDLSRLSKDEIQTIDPRSILLIGCKKREFPINKLDNTNLIKNKTLERFRRNNRNIDVLTYDELFERAYHIVFSKRIPKDWYWINENQIFIDE
jgi:hypothetical protein